MPTKSNSGWPFSFHYHRTLSRTLLAPTDATPDTWLMTSVDAVPRQNTYFPRLAPGHRRRTRFLFGRRCHLPSMTSLWANDSAASISLCTYGPASTSDRRLWGHLLTVIAVIVLQWCIVSGDVGLSLSKREIRWSVAEGPEWFTLWVI